MARRRPPHSYFALLGLLAFQAAVVAIPGGPYLASMNLWVIALGVFLLVMLGRGSWSAWLLATLLAGVGALGAVVVPLAGPDGGPMAGIDRVDTGVWLACIVVTFALLLSPSMRRYVRGARPQSV